MTAQRGTVFDLDAANAARREAEGERFTFRWAGREWECAPAKEWPIGTAGALSKGDLMGAILLIMGDVEGQAFLDTNPSMGDVEALMDALAAFSGVTNSGE